MGKTVGTGIRMTPAQREKLDALARQLAVSRNQMVGILIEGAQVESRPAVSIRLEKKNSRRASVSQAKSATAVGA